MIALSPSKLISLSPTDAGTQRGPEWFRLARSSDGILCLESISDATLNRSGPAAEWAFGAEVPRHIARQLTDDQDPDQVAKVLDRAIRALGHA
jgi:hypothetical protein